MAKSAVPLKRNDRRHEDERLKAIFKYFVEHPSASDTLEGIAARWIMRKQVRVEINTLAGLYTG